MAKKKLKGLGDVIATVTEAVGIEPCKNCNDRKEKLNKLLPFGTLDLQEGEIEFLTELFNRDFKDYSQHEKEVAIEIYFRVFQKDKFIPSGDGVYLNFFKKLARKLQ
jgi:hypothetical protein